MKSKTTRPASARNQNTLLKKHPGLQAEAEDLARNIVSSSSIEEIAEDVHSRITSIDLDDLNGRAGAHSWG